jgi:hypothetical protein
MVKTPDDWGENCALTRSRAAHRRQLIPRYLRARLSLDTSVPAYPSIPPCPLIPRYLRARLSLDTSVSAAHRRGQERANCRLLRRSEHCPPVPLLTRMARRRELVPRHAPGRRDQIQMGWLRRNIRVTTSFALLVLAMHFALTFGHPHVESLINPAVSILSGPGSADSSIEALPSIDGNSHGLPARPSKNSDSHYCAICANIDLASSLLFPAAPLLVPRNVGAHPARGFEFEPMPLDCTAFDARGPPLT